MYAIMLLFASILGAISLSPGLQDVLKKVPFCANSTSVSAYAIPSGSMIDCSSAVGYLAVYRICFALVCFFMLMAVMMIGVRSSRDPRAPIQNGFWGIKFLIVVAITIGAFFIPEGSFGTTWMWVSGLKLQQFLNDEPKKNIFLGRIDWGTYFYFDSISPYC